MEKLNIPDPLMLSVLSSLAIEYPDEPLYKYGHPGCMTIEQWNNLK